MDAGGELLDFVGVALVALRWRQILGCGQFMHTAVTRSAGRFSEESVGAGGERFRLIGVARGALDFFDFGGMRKVLDASVAILAAEHRVCTRGVLSRINGNVSTLTGRHARGAMAGETSFILFGGLRLIGGNASGSEHPRYREQHATENQAALPFGSAGAHKAPTPG